MAKKNRKYQLTINNPLDHDMDRETIISICDDLDPVYYCMSDEIGLEEETPHTHIFIAFENPRSFNTIKNSFPTAHIEQCNGTSQENKDYVFKEGKYLNDPKADTNIRESHYEKGDLPKDEQGKRSDLKIIYDLIDQGYDAIDIVEENPQFSFRLEEIKKIINAKKQKEYRNKFRDIDVTYIYGSTGTGKTRYVMDKYGYDHVCRITDYKHPFDDYQYEDVVIFEEFREDIQAKDMLKYLDPYPLNLPARFANKQACYTKVYIISNIKVEEQYYALQRNERETYNAFRRRINRYMEFDEHGNKMVFLDEKDYRNRKFVSLEEYEKGAGNEKE